MLQRGHPRHKGISLGPDVWFELEAEGYRLSPWLMKNIHPLPPALWIAGESWITADTARAEPTLPVSSAGKVSGFN